MKRPSRMQFHLLVAVTLALLLALALAGTALANPPGGPGGPGNGPGHQAPVNNGPGNGPGGPGSGPGNQQPAPTATPTATPTPAPSAAHPDAPSTPSGDCIVSHAATPAQLCPVGGGLQYYFIGSDGSSSIGPYLAPFSELATLYTTGTSALLYNGINPFTSKSVQIHYLPADSKIRISTYYPDTQYDTNKPYTFTVDTSNSVTHEAW